MVTLYHFPGSVEGFICRGRKMRIIRAAAMAPADPSPQDRKEAAQADAAIVVRQATATLAGLNRAAGARLDFTA